MWLVTFSRSLKLLNQCFNKKKKRAQISPSHTLLHTNAECKMLIMNENNYFSPASTSDCTLNYTNQSSHCNFHMNTFVSRLWETVVKAVAILDLHKHGGLRPAHPLQYMKNIWKETHKNKRRWRLKLRLYINQVFRFLENMIISMVRILYFYYFVSANYCAVWRESSLTFIWFSCIFEQYKTKCTRSFPPLSLSLKSVT